MKITNIEDIVRHPTGKKLKNRLTPKQQYVIELRYGWKDGYRYTYREIAKFMGISHVAVHKHEKAALRKLQSYAINPDNPVVHEQGKWLQQTRKKHGDQRLAARGLTQDG